MGRASRSARTAVAGLFAGDDQQFDADRSARLISPANELGSICPFAPMNPQQPNPTTPEWSVLQAVSAMLAGRTELQGILDGATRLLVELLNFHAASIRLVDESSGELRIASYYNMSQAYLDKGPLRAESSAVDSEALTGKAVYVADLRSDPRTVYREDARREGIVSGLITPLSHGGSAFGVLRVYTKEPYEFPPNQIALVQTIATQVAAAIVNARLTSELREADRLERQIRVAAEVQRRMIPSSVPKTDRFSFGCVYEPSWELCGDFYDFLEFPSGDIGVVIADVVGKGVPASLLMASARAALRSHAKRVYDVNEIMEEVNLRLHKDTLDSEFATAFYGVLSADAKRLTYCSAGHDPPMLLREGKIRELDIGGMPLGIDGTVKYVRSIEHLRPGDLILMYTDGVIDAANYEGDSFGRGRLQESLIRHAALPPTQLAKQILWDVRRYAGLARLMDDITLVAIGVNGPARK